MPADIVSSQMLNGLLACFESLSSVVFWVCDANHKKQIYLNKGFETVWGRPKEFLYNEPEAWATTLLPEDLASSVVPHWDNSAKCYTASFRIYRPSGELQYIKSSAYVVVDNSSSPIAVAGVDEVITPEYWHELNTNKTLLSTSITQDFANLLQSNFQLLTTAQPNPLSAKSHPVLLLNGNPLAVAKREMECLHYLLRGYSAKQTAYALHLSTRTVEKYLNNLRKKFKCRTKVELLNKLYRENTNSF